MVTGIHVCLVVMLAFVSSAYGRFLFAPLVQSQRVVIDGRADEAVWQRANPISLKSNPGGVGMTHSVVRLLADADNLYVFGDFKDAKAQVSQEPSMPRDQINWGDAAEIFLSAPGEIGYYHIAIDSQGNLYDSEGQASARDFQSDVEWKVKKEAGRGWHFEMRLPLADFKIKTPLSIGGRLELNICRSSKALPGNLFSAFHTQGSFHSRSAFGTLHIGNARQVALKTVKGMRKELGASYAGCYKRADAMRRSVDFRALMKDLDNRKRMGRLQHMDKARLWLFEAHAGQLPAEEEIPVAAGHRLHLHLEALKGEILTAAAGVFNPREQAVRLRCVPSAVLDSATLDIRDFSSFGSLSIPQAVTIRGGIVQRDPLPSLRIEDVVTVLPGANQVILMGVDTSGLAAGTYEFSLALKPLGPEPQAGSVSVTLEVYGQMPARRETPLVLDFARPHWPPAQPHSLDLIFRMQQDYGTNVVMSDAMGRDMEYYTMSFDDAGRLGRLPSFGRLSHKFRCFGKDAYYFLGMWRTSLPRQFMEGPHAVENLRRYLTQLATVASRHGIPSRHILLSLADEPRNLQAARDVALVGDLLHKALPDTFTTFVTIDHNSTDDMYRHMAPYVSIFCPKIDLTAAQLKRLETFRRKETKVMGYRVLSRNKSPYGDYRLSGLQAWSRGMIGMGYWNFCDAGDAEFSSTWDDFDPCIERSDFATIYEGSAAPIPSVRLEMWRQGIQDYRLAQALKEAGHPEVGRKVAEVLRHPGNAQLGENFRSWARRTLAGRQASAGVKPLVCLTGNSRVLPNVPFQGNYTYDGGTYGAMSKLVDGNLRRPQGYIHSSARSMTFDLQGEHELAGAVFCAAGAVGESASVVKVSMDGNHWASFAVKRRSAAARGHWYTSALKGARGRFVQLDFGTVEHRNVGEVMIYGR